MKLSPAFLLPFLSLCHVAIALIARQPPTRVRRDITGTLAAIKKLASAETTEQNIKNIIKYDVDVVSQQFNNIPQEIRDLVRGTVSQSLSQQIFNLNSTQQFENLAKQINANLQKVQDEVITDIAQLKLDPSSMDDSGKLEALQDCITKIVAQGGLKEDQKCLSDSGYTIESLKSQFVTFVEINDFQIPTRLANEAANNVTKYLDSVNLNPGTEKLISDASAAMLSVVATQSGANRDAAILAFDCFTTALQQISTEPLATRYLQCNLGNTGNGYSKSTLERIQNSYIAGLDPISGFLPPNIVQDVQRAGLEVISVSLDPYSKAVRTAINDAILSRTAAVTPRAVTLSKALITCLNTQLDLTNDNDCDPAKSLEVAKINDEVARNAVAQFVSILPLQMVNAIKNNIAEIAGTASSSKEVQDLLDQLQKEANLGPEYDSCYGQFANCMLASLSAGADQTCKKGPACEKLPSLAVNPTDPTSPYYAIFYPDRLPSSPKRLRRGTLPPKPRKVIRVYQTRAV